jgi:excisionase family DNA binding protein
MNIQSLILNTITMEQSIFLVEKRLENIERMLTEQSLATKEILNFNEAALFLDISRSHLYKLTSQKQIPHFCPQGKRLYFKRMELQEWLLRNRQEETESVEERLNNLTIGN